MKSITIHSSIKCSSGKVIQAFLDPTALKEWWGVERALIEPMVGGLFILAWQVAEQGLGYVTTGIISAYEPEKQLIVKNLAYLNPARSILGPMNLIVRVTTKGGGADLYLCQDGYQSGGDWDWYFEAVHIAWPIVIESLKQYLEK